MKLKFLLVCAVAVLGSNIAAQVTLSNGHHTLEISGSVSTYYNYRHLKDSLSGAALEDHSKDRFALRDAQLQLEGRYKSSIEYEIQLDFADLASGGIDPENPGIMDAYVVFKGLKFIDIKGGYTKVPYGRANQVPFLFSPFWQRSELARGNFFSRRDVGVTLEKSFWKQRAKIQAGAYTGLGEVSLKGDNDASGNLEYIARAELAYPSRYRYRDIDDRITPIPMVVVGINGRYADKRQPVGEFLPQGAGGEDGLKVIDGIKKGFGIDLSAQYMGFSTQFEIHQFFMTPNNANSVLFQGVPSDFHKGYVRMGGYFWQFNYFSKPLRSIFSVRYDEINFNDLAEGLYHTVSAAYAYQLSGFNCMVKLQYWRVLSEEELIDPLKWTDQFRIGFQYKF
jgi:hypothetical protein